MGPPTSLKQCLIGLNLSGGEHPRLANITVHLSGTHSEYISLGSSKKDAKKSHKPRSEFSLLELEDWE